MTRQWQTQQKPLWNSSSTPAKTGLFQSRPFAEPTHHHEVLPEQQETEHWQTHGATPIGHNFSQLQITHNTDRALEAEAQGMGARSVWGKSAPETPQSASAVSSGTGGHLAIQRSPNSEDKPFWESPWFGTATDAAGYIPGAGGALSAMLHSFDVVNGVSAATEGNYLGAALSSAKVGSTFAGLAAELGGFSLNSAALGTAVGEGLSLPTMAGLATAGEAGGAAAGGTAALGPLAAVAGAGLAGYGVGTLIAENTGVDEAIGDGLFDLLGPEPGLWLADTFGL